MQLAINFNLNPSPDPSVCPLHTSSPSPNALRAPRLVDVVHRDRPWAARRTVGGRRRQEGSVPRGRGFGFARAMSISPRTTVIPLILHPTALQWSERAERASFQQTKPTNLNQYHSKLSVYVCDCAIHLRYMNPSFRYSVESLAMHSRARIIRYSYILYPQMKSQN